MQAGGRLHYRHLGLLGEPKGGHLAARRVLVIGGDELLDWCRQHVGKIVVEPGLYSVRKPEAVLRKGLLVGLVLGFIEAALEGTKDLLAAARRTGCHKVLIFVHAGSDGQHDAEELASYANSIHIDLLADPDQTVEEINDHLKQLAHPEPIRQIRASERQEVN